MLKIILFIGSVISLTIGLIGFGEASQWGVIFPLGAVLFILSFIVMLLEKESALYDAEQRQISEALRQVCEVPANQERHHIGAYRVPARGTYDANTIDTQ